MQKGGREGRSEGGRGLVLLTLFDRGRSCHPPQESTIVVWARRLALLMVESRTTWNDASTTISPATVLAGPWQYFPSDEASITSDGSSLHWPISQPKSNPTRSWCCSSYYGVLHPCSASIPANGQKCRQNTPAFAWRPTAATEYISTTCWPSRTAGSNLAPSGGVACEQRLQRLFGRAGIQPYSDFVVEAGTQPCSTSNIGQFFWIKG